MTMGFRFDFGPGDAKEGYTKVRASTLYQKELGYGFLDGSVVYERDRGQPDALRRDFCIPVGASFVVDVPNGNYTVRAVMGDLITATRTGIKAGTGRLITADHHAEAGEFASVTFTVHVHDGRLKLAFSGLAPRINALDITPAPQAATLFLAGDSTVTDQPEDGYPYAGWGQMLPLFVKADAAVANYAVSGRSSKSFIHEGRLEPMVRQMGPNDYLFIQFGHNDQKLDEERFTSPFTTYKQHLKVYVDEARQRGATPILVTSVQRRHFDEEGVLKDTHGDYITAMKQLAEEENVILVDLAAKSKQLFEDLGPEETKNLFMWTLPGEFPNFPKGVEDNTHFQERGGIAVAKLVVDSIKEQNLLPLSLYFR